MINEYCGYFVSCQDIMYYELSIHYNNINLLNKYL